MCLKNDRTHHDNEDSDKDSDKVGEESKSMLHIVKVPKVSPLNYFLGVHHHVPHENKEPKVQLQEVRHSTVKIGDIRQVKDTTNNQNQNVPHVSKSAYYLPQTWKELLSLQR